LHVRGQRVRVHRHFRVGMCAQMLRALHADSAIAKRRAFGGAGNNPNVLGHDSERTGCAEPHKQV
jgi:hypothetical protein